MYIATPKRVILSFGLCEAFLALLLMASWLREHPKFMNRHYDMIEFFAGRSRIGRLSEASGYFALAHELDLDTTESSSKCMDLNGSAGFMFLDILMCHLLACPNSLLGNICTFTRPHIIHSTAKPHSSLRLAILMLLCGHPEGAVVCLGIECSTFVFMSSASTRRTCLTPMGNRTSSRVEGANKYTSRWGLCPCCVLTAFHCL